MDNALAQVQPLPLAAAPAAPQDGALARMAAMPAKAKTMAVLGLAALAAVVVALTLWSREGDYKVLFAGLSDKDGGAILAQLSTMNVPYRYAEGGGAILVPADKVHDVRLKLASAGLPKGSIAGFELMDNARFGQTQFQERLTFQRGLEGELTRSITSLGAVQAARVHLALPSQNGFFREQQKPSASVLLTLYPGRALDRAQIAGIVHLVSASVPELNPKAVSVLDGTGALLSGPSEVTGQGLDAQQLQYVSQVEQGYQKRVADILEPVVGRDNLRATVAAEVDFSQSESTSELFKPNQGSEPAAVRSQQTSESSQGANAAPSGVPGAASNQPPTPPTAPINGPAQQMQPTQAPGGAAAGSGRRDSVTNYEVDKTVRVTRNATGQVKRLNVAVVVNHRVVTDAKGKTTSTPLSAEEIEKLTALVQESIGYNKERGDSVRLVNAPFRAELMPKPEPVPLLQQPWLQDLLRNGAVPLAMALVGLAVVFGLMRPAMKSLAAKPAAATKGSQLDVAVADEVVMPGDETQQLGRAQANQRLLGARTLAKENPAAVASIVRGWVSKETA